MITVVPFSPEEFGADFEETATAPVEYLRAYLKKLGAATIVREEHYVDRHFLSDFAQYYSRSFRAPPPYCRRLHYFAISPAETRELLQQAYQSEDSRAQVESELGKEYLGFVVVRPLRGAAIGRTVLRTYPDDGGRVYSAARRYHVHIASLRLEISGLAFQQQDVGAAVCASTALWSALQKVAHLAGKRTPTPNEITRASGSPFPASFGLDTAQMATALSSLGYAADTFAPNEDSADFRAKLGACLRAHLPVILAVRDETQSHAITVAGFREPSRSGEVSICPTKDGVQVLSAGIDILYVHDDNLGPYAHYELHDEPPDEHKSACYTFGDTPDRQLWLLRGGDVQHPDQWVVDCLQVEAAIVPKPSKIRMAVDDLIECATTSYRTLMESIFDFDGLSLVYDAYFTTGVEYRRSLLSYNLDCGKLREFDLALSLPRHMAVVRVLGTVGEDGEDDAEDGDGYRTYEFLCDLLLDATGIELRPGEESLLAVVAPRIPSDSLAGKYITSLERDFDVPCMLGWAVPG